MRWCIVVTVVVACLASGVGAVWAVEQRCNEIVAQGGTCVCSEPFQMTGFGAPTAAFWDPNDSTSQQCATNPTVPNASIEWTTTPIVRSDAAALNALPSRNPTLVQRYASGPDGHEGGGLFGSGTPVSAGLVRLAARWYQYYSPTHQFKHEGGCLNSKAGEFIKLVLDHDGTFHTYNYLAPAFSPGFDCCGAGQPAAVGGQNFTASQLKGKWWRMEVVFTGRQSSSWRMQFFMRNVTDNQPEVPVLDSATMVSGHTPSALMSTIMSNWHRFGTCSGYKGIVYYAMAGWTTNANQRIGATAEVESGTAAPLPGTPINVQVSGLWGHMWRLWSWLTPPNAYAGVTR